VSGRQRNIKKHQTSRRRRSEEKTRETEKIREKGAAANEVTKTWDNRKTLRKKASNKAQGRKRGKKNVEQISTEKAPRQGGLKEGKRDKNVGS
jgi:hypothetical protein